MNNKSSSLLSVFGKFVEFFGGESLLSALNSLFLAERAVFLLSIWAMRFLFLLSTCSNRILLE